MLGSNMFGMGLLLNFRNNARTGMRSAKHDFDQLRLGASKADRETAASLQRIGAGFRRARTAMFLGAAGMGVVSALSMSNKETEQYTADLASLGAQGAKAHVKSVRQILAYEDLPLNYSNSLQQLYNEMSGGVAESDLVPVLKKVGLTALATIGDISDTMRAFVVDYNLSLKNMSGSIEDRSSRWADIFSATVKNYMTKAPELAEQHRKVASDVAQLGYDLETTYPAIGTLLSGGMEGDAGTSLSRALLRISNASKVTGLQFVDTNKKALPLLDIIDLLNEKYGPDITVPEKDEIKQAFDIYGSKSIIKLMELRDMYADGIEAAKQFGFHQEMAGERTDTLKMDLIALGSSFRYLGDIIAENGINMRRIIQWTDDAVDSISKFLEKHPEVVKIAMYSAGGISVAAVGGGLLAILKLMLTTYTAMKGLGAIAGLASGGSFMSGATISTIGTSIGSAAGTSMLASFSSALSISGIALPALMTAKLLADEVLTHRMRMKNKADSGWEQYKDSTILFRKPDKNGMIVVGEGGVDEESGPGAPLPATRKVKIHKPKTYIGDLKYDISEIEDEKFVPKFNSPQNTKQAPIVLNYNTTIYANTIEEARRKSQAIQRKQDAELMRTIKFRGGEPTGAS